MSCGTCVIVMVHFRKKKKIEIHFFFLSRFCMLYGSTRHVACEYETFLNQLCKLISFSLSQGEGPSVEEDEETVFKKGVLTGSIHAILY